MKPETFKRRCEKVAETLGLDVSFYDDAQPDRENVDDGTLHITRSGLRACFNVDQGRDDGKLQNENTRAVLAAMKIKVGDNVLVDVESEDGDQYGDEQWADY